MKKDDLKIKKVMHEWKRGKLKSSSGQKVKNQKQALTWARTAELSGRGVPSRAQRSISARILSSILSSGT